MNSAQAHASSPAIHTLSVLIAAAVGLTVLLALLPDAGHDQLWLLLAAGRMGPHLDPYGPLVFESNPPLAIWLSAIVVALARLLHLALPLALKLSVAMIAAVSALVSARLLRRLNPDLTRAGLCFLAFAFVLIFGAVPARDFGQRDHILTLLILPYLLAAAIHRAASGRDAGAGSSPAPLGRWSRFALALAAAVGIALKPHQALIPVAVELTLLLGARPRRSRIVEPLVFLLAGIGYFAAIHLFAPTYFTEVLPTLRSTYWAFGSLNLFQLQAASIQLHILLIVTVALFVLRPGRREHAPQSPLIALLLAAGIAALIAYLLQGTGWYYQQLPAISLLSLALALQLIDLAPRMPVLVARRLPAATAALSIIALTLATYFSDFHPTPRGLEQPQPTPDPAFFAELLPGAAVATLTTTVDDTVVAAFRYHVTLAQRYPHLWMLPAILRNEFGSLPGADATPRRRLDPTRLAELDRLQHRYMVEDLTRWQPALILVARCQDPAVRCQVLEDRHDDLLAFFLRDPAFAAIFRHYHFTRRAGMYDAYARN